MPLPEADVRQIVLDTETTGLEVEQGHRIIEIGCVELQRRRYTRNDFHQYLNPGREIEAGAIEVHGITNEFLADKPGFQAIADDLWQYLKGAELIIHNAPFDVGFLNIEFARAGYEQKLEDICRITDTVSMARRLLPGQRVSLDALCKRYSVDNSGRDLHGALLDSRLLADVYLAMTGGQSRLALDSGDTGGADAAALERFLAALGHPKGAVPVVPPSAAEWQAHREWLKVATKKAPSRWAADLEGVDPR